jgi:hypothetical protein
MEKKWFEAFVSKMDLWIRRRATAASELKTPADTKRPEAASVGESVRFLSCWRLYVSLLSEPLSDLRFKTTQFDAVIQEWKDDETKQHFLGDVRDMLSWILITMHARNQSKKAQYSNIGTNICNTKKSEDSVGLTCVLLISLCLQPLRLFLLTLPRPPEQKIPNVPGVEEKILKYAKTAELVPNTRLANAVWTQDDDFLFKPLGKEKRYGTIIGETFGNNNLIVQVHALALRTRPWTCNADDLRDIAALFPAGGARSLRFTHDMMTLIRPPTEAVPELPEAMRRDVEEVSADLSGWSLDELHDLGRDNISTGDDF